jgi:hypothetical protein
MFALTYVRLGYQQYSTALSSAIPLSLIPALSTRGTPAYRLLLSAEVQNVRWRDDGVALTTTVGFLLKTSDPPFEYSGNILALQFIQVTAGAILSVLYFQAIGN